MPLPRPKKPLRWLILLLGLAAFSYAYLHIGGLLISQTNNADKDILGADQKHNLKVAILTHGDRQPASAQNPDPTFFDFLPHRTDGVVNPLWPWLASFLVDASSAPSSPDEVTASDRALFDSGRRLNLGITLGFLCLLGFTLTAYGFSLPATFNILLLGGLGALLPRSAYFQPEPVYYIFFFLAWTCALALIVRKKLPLYFVFGCLLGLAYLAKSSIQPLIAAFFAVTAYQFVRDFLTKQEDLLHRALTHVAGLALVALGFALFAGPRLATAKSQFGSRFHSYPGYWMWMDDFDTAFRWMEKHPDARTLAAVTPDEKPTFSNYARTHSGPVMWHRLTDGFWQKTSELFASETARRDKTPRRPWVSVLEHRGLYLLALLLILSATLTAAKNSSSSSSSSLVLDSPSPYFETGPLLIFVLGTFALSALAYGWYSPIGKGDRFMLSLYLPLTFTLIAAADFLARRFERKTITTAYLTAQSLITVFLTWRIAEILTWPHFAP